MNQHGSVRPHSSIKAVADKDGGVLLDGDRGLLFSLNEVGSTIWQRLTDGQSIAEIVQAIAERYTISRQQVEADVVAFIADLESQHLLVRERHE